MNLTLDEMKGYLRVDGDFDDGMIQTLIEAGKGYLYGAGVAETEDPRYKLALMLYVGAYYENRDGLERGSKFSYGLQSILLQLRDGI